MKRLRALTARFLLAIAIPLLLLGLAELLLPWTGIGFPTDAFVPATSAGRPVWTDNPFFSYRFFPPPLARMAAPVVVPAAKPPGAIRIVVLGESAIQGDPYLAYGAPRFLEALLRQRFPGRDIDVINAAVTAISTPALVEIARELPHLKPDVVIVYAGNNDVIGPLGAVTGLFRLAPADWMIRAVARLNRLHLVQAATLLQTLLVESRGPMEFTGVGRMLHRPVPFSDARLPVIRRRYAANLRAILRQAQRAGAEVLLCTVAVNRTDCPPALSRHRPDLAPDDLRQWEHHVRRGTAAADRRDDAGALEWFARAAELDDAHAELAYRSACCLERLGRQAEARERFQRAVNLDAFRFRMDAPMNAIVRDVAAAAPPAVRLVDIDRLFVDDSDLPDAERFLDHVHFTPAGNHCLAILLADALLDTRAFRDAAPATPAWASREEAEAELLFTAWSRHLLAQRVLSRYANPPFKDQFDISLRRARWQAIEQSAAGALADLDPESIHQAYLQRARQHPDDLVTLAEWGLFLKSFNRRRDLQAHLGPVLERCPFAYGLRGILAGSLAAAHRPDAAVDVLLGPERRQGFRAAGTASVHLDALIANGQEDEALAYARALAPRLRRLDFPWRIHRHIRHLPHLLEQRDQAWAKLQAGEPEPAADLLADLCRFRPDWPTAPFLLAMLRARTGHQDEARSLLASALRRWHPARALYHLALWEQQVGPSDHAHDLLDQAAARAGDDEPLVNSLAWLRPWQPDLAAKLQALALHSSQPARLMDTQAALLAAREQYPDAVRAAAQAREQARAQGDTALAEEIVGRLEDYRRGRPAAWGSRNRPMNILPDTHPLTPPTAAMPRTAS